MGVSAYSRLMTRPVDTSPEAWRAHLDALRRMTGPERVAKAFEMSEAARALSEAGIRHRHPHWSDEQVQDALMELLLGAELARTVRRSRGAP
jgi:Rv0078B-related antitoxin